MKKTRKLINCDLGECLVLNPDGQIMPWIDQASIACGGHAGNDDSMAKTIKLAKQYQVSIGAHPSYPDKKHFGRRSIAMSLNQLFDSLVMQVTTLNKHCRDQKVTMDYLKPHGALYHDIMHQAPIAEVICDVIKATKQELKLVVQAGVNTEQIMASAAKKNVQLQFEAFADRAYQGVELRLRTEEGAVLATPEEIENQYYQLSASNAFQIDTICFHSDHPPSVKALQHLQVRTTC